MRAYEDARVSVDWCLVCANVCMLARVTVCVCVCRGAFVTNPKNCQTTIATSMHRLIVVRQGTGVQWQAKAVTATATTL